VILITLLPLSCMIKVIGVPAAPLGPRLKSENFMMVAVNGKFSFDMQWK